LVRSTREVVQGSIDRCADELFAVRGLFESSALVHTNEWEQFISVLDLPRRHPGIRSISFAELVRREEREAFEQRVREELHPDFGIVRRGDPPISFFTTYLTQFPTSEDRRLGWDSYSDEPRRPALDFVLTNRTPAASGKTLMATSGQRSVAGFVMLVPVYRTRDGATNLHGLVLGRFAPQEMLAEQARRQLDSRVRIEFFDTG
jgi:CHASE1-domain containing sensor protein